MSEAPRWKNDPPGLGLPSGPRGVTISPSRRRGVRLRSFIVAFMALPVKLGRLALVPVDEGPLLPPLTGVADCPGVWLLATVFPATSTGILRIASRFAAAPWGTAA